MHPRRAPRLSSRWSSPRTARLRVRSMADVGPCCIGPVSGSAWRKGLADPRRGSRAIFAMYQRVCMKMASVAEGTCFPICIGTVAALETENLAFLSSPSPQSPRFAPGQHGACGLGGLFRANPQPRFLRRGPARNKPPSPRSIPLHYPSPHIAARLRLRPPRCCRPCGPAPQSKARSQAL